MICEDCGETNKPGTEFCMFCGAYLGWQAQQNPGANEVTQELPSQSTPPATAAPVQRLPASASGATPAAPAASPQMTPSAPTSAPAGQPARRTAHPPAQAAVAQPQHPAATAAMPVAAVQTAPAANAPPAPPAPAAPVIPTCPACGRTVESGRRFCGHCGHQLIAPGSPGAPVTRPTVKRDTWWTRLWDRKDRGARREFRRSLPPLYRWRRVIIGVLTLGLLGGGLALIGRSPVQFVKARYYDLRNELDPVSPVTTGTIPLEGSAEGTDPNALVDGTAAAWAMPWTATTQGTGCGAEPTTTVIQLSFADTRIRRIDMRAGLLASNPNRLFQFRPQNIWIAYGSDCIPITLTDADRQQIEFDTKVPVNSLRIGVQSAYPPAQPEGVQPILAFTEITLEARPPLRR